MLDFSRDDLLGRYNTNETWVQSHMISFLIQNLNTISSWVFILIWYSTFLFIPNIELIHILRFPTLQMLVYLKISYVNFE